MGTHRSRGESIIDTFCFVVLLIFVFGLDFWEKIDMATKFTILNDPTARNHAYDVQMGY